MDGHRFDQLTKHLVTGSSRRQALRTLAGGLVATLAGLRPGSGAAHHCSPRVCEQCEHDPELGTCLCVPDPGASCPSTGPCTQGVCSETRTCEQEPLGDGTRCGDFPQRCCGGQCAFCPEGGVCSGTSCVCPAGSENCNGTCFPLCPPGRDRNQEPPPGTCRCLCTDFKTECSGTCVDLQTDEQHCGSCSNQCADTEICAVCQGSCEGQPVAKCCPTTGRTNCAGTCTNIRTDEANCGRCGTQCATGSICAACRGSCAGKAIAKCCPSTRPTNCSGVCVNTKTDEANCGGCGKRCRGAKVCRRGTCV